eukprot:SAG31_NODE_9846_length_1221_cov_0.926916_1_plen_253_part_10
MSFSYHPSPGLVTLQAELRWLEEQLSESSYTHSTVKHAVESTPFFGQNSGLVAFSRLPISDVEITPFTAGYAWHAPYLCCRLSRFCQCDQPFCGAVRNRRAASAKGVLRLQVGDPRKPKTLVDITTTHLEHQKRVLQRRQIHEVLSPLPRSSTGKMAAMAAQRTVAIGDFNICARGSSGDDGQEAYEMLQRKMEMAGLGSNLCQGLAWTCDRALAAQPLQYEVQPLTSTTVEGKIPQRFGTIDHCWVPPSWAA